MLATPMHVPTPVQQTKPRLSLVYPICNRTELFQATLLSLVDQTLPREKFELVVVDDGGTDETLVPMLTSFKDRLNIRYYRINVLKLPFDVYQYNNLLNDPGPALNVGIKKALGTWVVLTSPEIKHTKNTNLEKILYYKLATKHGLICDVWDPDLSMWIGGGPEKRALHFLAAFYRSDLIQTGGFDERFVGGWGYQDTEFRDRFAGPFGGYFDFNREVVGFHQTHPRVENFAHDGSVARGLEIYNRVRGQAVANQGHEWGSDNLIEQALWSD